MQNGAFGWATSLTSSLAAQKVSWSTGVGYQASLTDLFLKKNSLPFGSGISQLAAASSYLEKMSSASDHHHHHHHNHQPESQSQPHPHHHQQSAGRKCSHGHDKNKFTCDQCVADFSVPGPSSKSTTSHSFPEHPHHHSSAEKSPLHQHQSPHSGSASSPHHAHHMPPPSAPGPPQQPSVPQPQPQPQPQPLATTSQSCRRNSNNNSANRAKNTPVKHFLCPVCHRTFTQKGNLKTHMMIHSGDKPYACQVSPPPMSHVSRSQVYVSSPPLCLLSPFTTRYVARASLRRGMWTLT